MKEMRFSSTAFECQHSIVWMHLLHAFYSLLFRLSLLVDLCGSHLVTANVPITRARSYTIFISFFASFSSFRLVSSRWYTKSLANIWFFERMHKSNAFSFALPFWPAFFTWKLNKKQVHIPFQFSSANNIQLRSQCVNNDKFRQRECMTGCRWREASGERDREGRNPKLNYRVCVRHRLISSIRWRRIPSLLLTLSFHTDRRSSNPFNSPWTQVVSLYRA